MIKPSTKLYLTYCNDFLSVEGFASWLETTIEVARSLVARSKVMFLSESIHNRSYFTNNCVNLCQHYTGIREGNREFFAKRHANKLLLEHSA